MRILRAVILAFACSCAVTAAPAPTLERAEVQQFIADMAKKHGFSTTDLNTIFQNVVFSDSILDAISRPAESLPWYKYRPMFLERGRIQMGAEFWRNNKDTLQRAEQQFGVPAEILVAILGVETRYGRIKGKYAVLDSLSTLAFAYPKRSAFFLAELEQYLLLTRERGYDPLTLKGSYAGAMGIPQFVSSSFRKYAVDFDGDGSIDIWENPADAIGSVGNYFKQYGWRSEAPIAEPARVSGEKYKAVVTEDMMPRHTIKELSESDVRTRTRLPPETLAKLLVLETRNGNEYWLGFENFYVISRYNNSISYSMAVYQLAEEIKTSFHRRK